MSWVSGRPGLNKGSPHEVKVAVAGELVLGKQCSSSTEEDVLEIARLRSLRRRGASTTVGDGKLSRRDGLGDAGSPAAGAAFVDWLESEPELDALWSMAFALRCIPCGTELERSEDGAVVGSGRCGSCDSMG